MHKVNGLTRSILTAVHIFASSAPCNNLCCKQPPLRQTPVSEAEGAYFRLKTYYLLEHVKQHLLGHLGKGDTLLLVLHAAAVKETAVTDDIVLFTRSCAIEVVNKGCQSIVTVRLTVLT